MAKRLEVLRCFFMKNNFLSKFNWIYFLSKRFSGVDSSSRLVATKIIPSLGIGFGVMALIVIISVMNGFQSTSIDTLMEISSFHVRVNANDKSNEKEFYNFCKDYEQVTSVTPFLEAQGLLVGKRGKQQAALLRSVPHSIIFEDSGFANEVDVYSGEFDLETPMSICLGSELARNLGVGVGDTISILALSGNSSVDLFSDDRVFTVTGLFFTSNLEINSFYAFISLEDGRKILGNGTDNFYGLKLKDYNKDNIVIHKINENNFEVECQSWRDYNRSIFTALRIEKNVLLILVLLIFIVVGVNIFNGMRRMVFERREEICVLRALGADAKSIKNVFVIQGLSVGLIGAIPGLILGLLLCVRMDIVFSLLASISYGLQYFFTMLFNPSFAPYISENLIYLQYANIPAKINFGEVFYITIFGIISAVVSSWIASRNIMKFQVSEVLRDE